MSQKVLVVEDDINIAELLRLYLEKDGFEVKIAHDGGEGLKLAESEQPDLVLLDIMLPGEDGIAVLRRLRSSPVTADIPVIMATAKGSEYDRVVGLDLGADDYLSKPFGMMEMVSRIKAVLRRASPKAAAPAVLSLGEISLDPTRHSVSSGGREVVLTLKEYDLLKLLLEHPGQVFTREHLLSSVWGSDFIGESRTVDVHIGTLRTKLGAAGRHIQTVRGVGYKLEV